MYQALLNHMYVQSKSAFKQLLVNNAGHIRLTAQCMWSQVCIVLTTVKSLVAKKRQLSTFTKRPVVQHSRAA